MMSHPIPLSTGPRSASSIMETLIPIWKRVLRRPSIGIDDNFFDLGGDPAAAMELVSEIARAFGRNLTPVLIYQAPTIAALGALLEQPAAPRCPPLVLLKAGAGEPPVFMTHGLGGTVMELFALVKHIQSRHPIYGLQMKGADGVDQPLEGIEDMAEYYLEAVRKLQPRGPYQLIGYSLGGLVMLEMAQRLSGQGETVGLLAMLDSYPHRRYLAPGQRVRLVARLAKHYSSAAVRWPASKAAAYGGRNLHRRSQVSQEQGLRTSPELPVGAAFAPVIERVRAGARRALERYRPPIYEGKIRFVQARIRSVFPDDPAAVWGSLARDIEVEAVAGDHVGMITTHAENLASVLSRYLSETLGQV